LSARPFARFAATVPVLILVLAGACRTAQATAVLTESSLSSDGRRLELLFDGQTGLRGQAVFNLASDNRHLEILLTNTSYAIPNDPRFDNPSDQVLTSLYFDLGAPGLNPNDPKISGGGAWVADGSHGVGNSNALQSGADLSKLWGYGNFKYEAPQEFLGPNFVTTISAHGTAFANPASLKGPDYGALSSANLLSAFDTGLPTIADTIRFNLTLNTDIETLGGLVADGNFKPYIEFGSDFEFYVADDPPTTPEPQEPIPEPLTLTCLTAGAAALAGYLRRR
jgi:hypothetical protein